ncbi:MAG: DAK2 domain-containing protein [Anaerolineales bacterium]
MELDPQIAERRDYYRKKVIDGRALSHLVKAGLTWLRTNQEIVNALNVFPVPDGDTGTNMILTMQAAYDEISNFEETSFSKTIQTIAHGALMGARGNSGVILSQIWRGFARAVDNNDTLDAVAFAGGLSEARETAYKGVVRPVEGTILTVIKDISHAAEEVISEIHDPIQLLETIVNAAEESVERTPELLDVLKEAGVVDAGGKGLFFILEGMLRYIDGQPLDKTIATVTPLSELILDESMESIEPGQDWEVIVDFRCNQELDINNFFSELESMGTSIQFGEGDSLYRLHIHVPDENYYLPENYIKELGIVTRVAKENLVNQIESRRPAKQESEPEISPVEPGNIGVVAVVPGSGIAKIFASMGVAAIVEGGQTMNPSTEEIISKFENLPTEKIIILPNNKNIYMAAKNAAELSNKQVAVVPTKTIPQGLSAMLRLVPDGDFDKVVSEMNEAISEVETGEITTSTRTVEIDGVKARKGDIIALLNGRMVAATENLEKTSLALLEHANVQDYELITLFYGDNVTLEEARQIENAVRQKYPEHVIEMHEGRQPHYQFIFSIE